MTLEIEKEGSRRVRHVTTVAGPQAAALLNVLDGQHVMTWCNKSVDGLAVAELWVEITHAEEEAGTYT